MLRSRLDQDTVRASRDGIAEFNHLLGRTGPNKDSRVRGDSDDSAQNLVRYGVARVAVDDLAQPPATARMIARVGSEGMNENVDVWKDQRSSIRSSNSL